MALNTLKPIVRGGQIIGLNRPTYTLNRTLAANTAEDIAIPAGASAVLFKGSVDFYANFATTATVPADVTDGSASLLITLPVVIGLEGATGNISVISAYACQVNASFYK
jgi:hypothetical protein